MFKRIFKLTGIVVIGYSLWNLYELIFKMLNNQIEIPTGALFIFLWLGLGVGSGLMLMFFNPHQVMQTDSMNLFKLAQPRRDRRSFAEKIRAESDDE